MDQKVVHVVMVTEGTVIEYPPEIYADERRARLEAERWAWILAGGGWAEITLPFDGRWEVAGRDVRLINVSSAVSVREGVWLGTFWTADGYPDPEAEVLRDRDAAAEWVRTGPHAELPDEVTEFPWLLASTFRHGDDESYAVAWLAKLVT